MDLPELAANREPLVRPWSVDDGLAGTSHGARDVHGVVDRVCDRIDEVDDRVHAFLIEPDRRRRLHGAGEVLLERWPDPADRPPLFGVPVAIKDIVHVDGFTTRAGSEVPPAALAGPQASCVDRLLGAGALIAGKTVTAEFACVAPGPTANPHHLGHTPGGSSSGSAAAVAAGMVPLALGTQTIGSIIRPASFCGIVGFKPSYGRIPIDGVIPTSPTFDTVGVFASDVGGAALAASVLCDGWRPPEDGGALPVLGFIDGPYLLQAAQEARAAAGQMMGRLMRGGFEVRHTTVVDHPDEVSIHTFAAVRYELAQTHERWLADHRDGYQESTISRIEAGLAISEPEYEASRSACMRFRRELPDRMAEAGVDLLVAPSTLGRAPRGLDNTGDASMNLPWTCAGVPTVTLPIAGDAGALPLGLQLVGRPGADEQLLAAAARIEPVLRDVDG